MTNWIPTLPEGKTTKYKALADAIEQAVATGKLAPGDRLPTHRELADELDVTVGTVTRAYGEARKRGIICGTVGRGTYVAAGATADSSLMPERGNRVEVEMGFVAPLYQYDPDVREALMNLASQPDIQSTLCYDEPAGALRDRAAGAQWLKRYGVDVSADEVLICSGAQHGLNCALSGLLHEGDRVAVERMTYPGIKTLSAMLGITLVPIDMDDEGMIPDALAVACRRERVKAVFVMPGMQNPTTARMSSERRAELVALSERHDFIIIEDCAYDLGLNMLREPCFALAPERTVLIAGISKYFGAGLRTAYLVTGRKLRFPLRQALFNTVWMSSPITARLASLLIENGSAARALEQKLAESVERNKIAAGLLRGQSFKARPDGFFLWLDLPPSWNGPRFELAAADRNISVFCADKFAVGGGEAPNGVRISLSAPHTRRDLQFGIETLLELLAGSPQLSALL